MGGDVVNDCRVFFFVEQTQMVGLLAHRNVSLPLLGHAVPANALVEATGPSPLSRISLVFGVRAGPQVLPLIVQSVVVLMVRVLAAEGELVHVHRSSVDPRP